MRFQYSKSHSFKSFYRCTSKLTKNCLLEGDQSPALMTKIIQTYEEALKGVNTEITKLLGKLD